MLIISPSIAHPEHANSPNMDQLITIEEVAEFLKNPPSVSPRPDFGKVHTLQKHIIKALKQLECPRATSMEGPGSSWIRPYTNFLNLLRSLGQCPRETPLSTPCLHPL